MHSKVFLALEKYGLCLKLAVTFAMLIGYFCSLTPAAQLANVITPICSVYEVVKTAIFILGLTLLVLGAALYAGGNIAPGNLKGQIQGYGMGMIMGGIVGVILAVIAPWILTVISQNSTYTTMCNGYVSSGS